jgi:hypothetical protein
MFSETRLTVIAFPYVEYTSVQLQQALLEVKLTIWPYAALAAQIPHLSLRVSVYRPGQIEEEEVHCREYTRQD